MFGYTALFVGRRLRLRFSGGQPDRQRPLKPRCCIKLDRDALLKIRWSSKENPEDSEFYGSNWGRRPPLVIFIFVVSTELKSLSVVAQRGVNRKGSAPDPCTPRGRPPLSSKTVSAEGVVTRPPRARAMGAGVGRKLSLEEDRASSEPGRTRSPPRLDRQGEVVGSFSSIEKRTPALA